MSPEDTQDPEETGVTVELARIEPDGARSTELADPADAFREQLPGLEAEREVTDWGRSERIAALADGTVMRFLYHYWFRVEAEGLEHVPAKRGALLVANRAGQLPLDGAMIAKAVGDEDRLRRPVHLAATRTFAHLPGLGMAVTKLGGVGAHPANLHRLLFDERQLVLVFPEGSRAPAKPLRSRYRVRRMDQVDFVQAAMRAAVPIVPVAVLGAEEAMPRLATLRALGRGPRLPITTGVPLPAKFRLRFLQPVRTHDLGEAPWRDPALAQELTEEIRGLIQENLFELVAQRRSVWLG
jgi:1-acyl-sn-glycerol-3-phosphate acyltransferase